MRDIAALTHDPAASARVAQRHTEAPSPLFLTGFPAFIGRNICRNGPFSYLAVFRSVPLENSKRGRYDELFRKFIFQMRSRGVRFLKVSTLPRNRSCGRVPDTPLVNLCCHFIAHRRASAAESETAFVKRSLGGRRKTTSVQPRSSFLSPPPDEKINVAPFVPARDEFIGRSPGDTARK